MQARDRTLVILTATIAPMMAVKHANPDDRLNDYLLALSLWWADFQALPVDFLFFENSGHDTSKIIDWINEVKASERIRIFQFEGDKNLISKAGKGIGEAQMFDLCSSLGYLNSYAYVIKCTGRLFVNNASVLLTQAIDQNHDFAISVRSTLDFVDTRFFIIRSELFRMYLLNLHAEINDSQGQYIEHAIFKRLCKAISDGYRWGQYSELPSYAGIGGTDGKKHSNLLGKIRGIVKNCLHRLSVKYRIYLYL
jgi:hypothetical protein